MLEDSDGAVDEQPDRLVVVEVVAGLNWAGNSGSGRRWRGCGRRGRRWQRTRTAGSALWARLWPGRWGGGLRLDDVEPGRRRLSATADALRRGSGWGGVLARAASVASGAGPRFASGSGGVWIDRNEAADGDGVLGERLRRRRSCICEPWLVGSVAGVVVARRSAWAVGAAWASGAAASCSRGPGVGAVLAET